MYFFLKASTKTRFIDKREEECGGSEFGWKGGL